MSKPALDAFFFGRALAEVLGEKFEDALTDALSELGKFDAEQRERLRQFTQEVEAKAEREAEAGVQVSDTPYAASRSLQTSVDLQEMIDELRAEIARLRAEIKNYRGQSV